MPTARWNGPRATKFGSTMISTLRGRSFKIQKDSVSYTTAVVHWKFTPCKGDLHKPIFCHFITLNKYFTPRQHWTNFTTISSWSKFSFLTCITLSTIVTYVYKRKSNEKEHQQNSSTNDEQFFNQSKHEENRLYFISYFAFTFHAEIVAKCSQKSTRNSKNRPLLNTTLHV